MTDRLAKQAKQRAQRLCDFARNIKGVTAIEFGILAPLFFTFVLGTFEVAMAVYTHGTMKHSLQEVSRILMVSPDMTTAEAQAEVEARLLDLNTATLKSLTVTETANDDDSKTTVIQIAYEYTFDLPLIGTFPIELEAQTSILRN